MSAGAEPPMVRLEGLIKRYRGASEAALDGLSLTVRRGEFFGLLGPNGCGKTTTISIVCGVRRATQGEVRVCDVAVQQNQNHVKRQIGLVPQEIALYPSLTLTENLRYFGALHGMHSARLQQRIAECLHIAQLERFADRQVRTFSGGMQRRANLVVGLIHEPPLLFLDEPTLGVDPQSRNVMFESLKALRDAGTTLVYTSHYMEEVEQLCSRLAIMDRGRVIAEGTAEELIRRTPDCETLGDVFLALTGRQLRD